MKRLVAAGLVAIAAGCGQTSEFIAADDPNGPGPVGHAPLPSIHGSINGGLAPSAGGGDAVADSTEEVAVVEAPLAESAPAPVEAPSGPPLEASAPAPPDVEPVAADESVTPTSATAAEPERLTGKRIGEWAARVNEDIITWNELETSAKERSSMIPEDQRGVPEVRDLLVRSVLDGLIDRVLILQHARRNELKNPKAWDFFTKEADKVFDRERLPVLLKKYAADDKYALERIMTERGESLPEARQAFRNDFVARQYLIMKVAPKINVDLPELRAYYQENRGAEAFQHPEQLTWREVCVDVAKHPSRAAARAKAEAALARIRRGEDFAAVARELGEGPNAKDGGLWEKTTPGSYGVVPVNQALAALPPGQPSGIIEGPKSFHVVRVDSHVAAGALTFEEVQTQIRDVLRQQKEMEEMDSYLNNLYRGAVITTVFEEYRARDQRPKAR